MDETCLGIWFCLIIVSQNHSLAFSFNYFLSFLFLTFFCFELSTLPFSLSLLDTLCLVSLNIGKAHPQRGAQ